jgi:hypothetical protein
VKAGRARGLREARQVELVHHLLDDERDLADARPRIPLARVEVDEHVIRLLDVLHTAVPGVEVDAAEVDDPGEAGRVRDDREVSRAPAAREQDVHCLEPFRMLLRHTLLVEEEAVDAVRVAEHLHRPLAHVREEAVGEVKVVPDEVALGQPPLREEDLFEIRELNFSPADPHGAEPTEAGRPNPLLRGRRPAMTAP